MIPDPIERCENCKTHISWGEYNFSMNLFKKALCIPCQKKERDKTYPPKLAKFLNKNA